MGVIVAYCVYYPLNIRRNTRDLKLKLGNITGMFPSFRWGISSHETRLDQSRDSTNIFDGL